MNKLVITKVANGYIVTPLPETSYAVSLDEQYVFNSLWDVYMHLQNKFGESVNGNTL